MPLTFEQFQELRKKGLSPEQIAKFETGFTPKKQEEQKQSFGSKILGGLEKVGGILQKAGEMFLNPTINAIQTGITQPIREVQEKVPGGKTGHEVYQTPFGENKNVKDLSLGQKILQPIDVASAGLPVENIVKTPLTKIAQKLYQSGLKAKDISKAGKVVSKAEDIAKIGLEERIWLTKGGVEKVAAKIDKFEEAIDAIIESGKTKGAISVNEVVKYVDEAKGFFANQANRIEAKNAIQYLDELKKGFRKDFGPYMSLQKAQEVKVATGQALKKYYNAMTSAAIEGEKQLVRGLKEKIVEKVPQMGDINQRLSNLYKFDQALTKASGRIGNLNLLGLPSKIAGGVGGVKGLVAGKLLELLDAPSVKSGVAISLDRLAKASGSTMQGIKVPLSSLITYIVDEISSQEDNKQ